VDLISELDQRTFPIGGSDNSVDWAKKPGKMTTIKFVKDPKVPRDDIYKSSTVHVPEGLPPNSESRPTPRGRSTAKQAYPTQQYPQQSYGTKPRTSTAGRSPQGRQQNGFPQVVQQPQVIQQARVPVPQTSRPQPPPPPPPPPMQPPAPVAPPQPIYRAIYDFQGQTTVELSFSKGEVLDIAKKEGNGNV
jgi:myosin-1